MWHVPMYDDSIAIEYTVETEPVTSPSARITDSSSVTITDSSSARITDSPSARITYSPSARNTDSPSARNTDSPFTRITDSPSADLSWDSIQSPPITSTPFIRRPARRTPYSRRNQNEEIWQKQENQLKEEIQHLNDRLLSYKKSVQFLKLENSHLKQEIQTSQETITREISNFSTMFDINKLKFDQMKKKCINLDMDNKSLQDANKDLKNQY